jgi:hypothetical protein
MSPLLGLFGLGPTEFIVLALIGMPVIVSVAVVVIVVLATRRRKGDPDNE